MLQKTQATLEQSPIQVLTELNVAWLQWSYENWYFQVDKPLRPSSYVLYILNSLKMHGSAYPPLYPHTACMHACMFGTQDLYAHKVGFLAIVVSGEWMYVCNCEREESSIVYIQLAAIELSSLQHGNTMYYILFKRVFIEKTKSTKKLCFLHC